MYMGTRAKLIELVKEAQGLKWIELACRSFAVLTAEESLRVNDVIEAMIAEGELIEVEYALHGRAKSFLLPAGTPIRISSGHSLV